jgi:hypothetical protein
MNTNLIILICGLVVLAMCGYMLYITKKIDQTYSILNKRLERLETNRGIPKELECEDGICKIPQRVNIEKPIQTMNNSGMSGGIFPSFLNNMLFNNNRMGYTELDNHSQNSNEIMNDIQRLRQELGDEDIDDVSEDLEDIQEIDEEDVELINANIDKTTVSNENIDKDDILSNGKIKNENIRNNMSQFDELDDTEPVENNELDVYMNSKLNENMESDLEKHLDEQPDTVSNLSISAMQQLTEPFANASIEVKVNIIANNWKLNDLKELCKKNNITHNGNKQQLVKKLIEKYPDIFEKEQPKEKNEEEHQVN